MSPRPDPQTVAAAARAVSALTGESAERASRTLRRLVSALAVTECRACDLRESATAPVPGSIIESRLLLIGEAPGMMEDTEGTPFVGRSGDLLDRLLGEAGIPRESVSVTNVVRCRPPGNKFAVAVDAGAPDACRVHLDREARLSGAWLVVLFGASSLSAVLGQYGIGKHRGRPVWAHLWGAGRLFVPTYHPAYALRNPDAGVHIAADLRLARGILDGVESATVRLRKAPPVVAAEAAESMAGRRFTDADRDGWRRQLSRHGWAVMHSNVLGHQIAVCESIDVAPPAPLDDLPRWTVDELLRVHRLAVGGSFGLADLERVSVIKSMIPGSVVVG